MKTLSENDIIELFREEWDKKLRELDAQLGMCFEGDTMDAKASISAGLKLKHKKSGLKYTVDSVGPSDVVLKNPEGKKFTIDQEELQSNYELS